MADTQPVAPGTTTTTTTQPTVEAEHVRTVEAPTTSTAAASATAPVTENTTADPATAADATTTPAAPPLTVIGQLKKAEHLWPWKFGLRTIICVINIIAIGSAAWLMSANRSTGLEYGFSYGYGTGNVVISVLIVLPLSLIWCLLAMFIPFALKPRRPIHPGCAVGIDLVFWLGLIVAGLFTVVGIVDILQFGDDPTYLADPNWYSGSYNGNYYLASNGTWVYNITSSSGGGYVYNSTTGEYEYPPVDLSTITRDCAPTFETCAQQDTYVNQLWQEKGTRVALQVLVTAVAFIDVLLHFTLFVWACVDTHRYNRRNMTRKERIVAENIIADLKERGLISVHNGQVTGPGAGPYAWGAPYPPQGPYPPQQPMVQRPAPAAHAAAGFYGAAVDEENSINYVATAR